jgi:hypothetical protein
MGKRICLVCVSLFALFSSATYLATAIAGESKVLNNFVTELVREASLTGPATTVEFSLPRSGWVLISSVATSRGEGEIAVALGAEDQVVSTHGSDKQPEQEAMRHLKQGTHRVLIRCEGSAALESLSVRTIPDLLFYSCLDGSPGLIEHSPYDRELLESLIRKNVNHLIVHANHKLSPAVAQAWTDQGRRWIGGCGIAWGDEQQNYDYWTKRLKDNPNLDGLIADEFCPRARIAGGTPRFFPSQYRDCQQALERIRSENAFAQKQFVAYIGDWHRYIWEEAPETREFIRGLMDAGYRSSWERYCREQPNVELAEKYLKWNLTQPMQAWREEQPGVERHLIICLCLTTLPGHNLNIFPHVDYKVWMEMQVRHLATDPAFVDLAGLMWWGLGISEEETIRWAAKLMRHYAIEGKTEWLSDDPYELTHLKNPDFDDGTAGWTVQPAEEASIGVRPHLGFGNQVEGRVGVTAGNNVLWMKRSDKRANLISQRLQGLKRGRLYSVKVFASQGAGNKTSEAAAIRVDLQGVEEMPDWKFRHVYSRPGGVRLHYHWIVFRALDTTAQLKISDWQTTEGPGGAIGQETVCNFIEVQPYLEERSSNHLEQ